MVNKGIVSRMLKTIDLQWPYESKGWSIRRISYAIYIFTSTMPCLIKIKI